MDVYRKVTERSFGYVTLDLHPASADQARVLSHFIKTRRVHEMLHSTYKTIINIDKGSGRPTNTRISNSMRY